MRRSAVLVALLTLAAAVVCVRLGLWQRSRWHEKLALESARRAALAAPALVLADPARAPLVRVSGRVVECRGVWDTTHVVLLTGRTHEGSPGVELARPLLVPGGAVMIARGWLPSDDGVHTRVADSCGVGVVTVRGLAEPLRRGAGDFAPEPLAGSPGVFTARWLDADSLARRMPYALTGWCVRELPLAGAPSLPVRIEPRPLDPGMHLGYAIQWFGFAAAFLAGGGFVLTRRRAR